LRKRGLQIATVNRDRTLQKVGGHRRQRAPIGREDQTTPPARPLRRHRLSHTETVERTHRILKQRQSGPDSATLRCALEHGHVMSGAAKPDRRSQSTDPGSNNDYPHRPIMPGTRTVVATPLARHRTETLPATIGTARASGAAAETPGTSLPTAVAADVTVSGVRRT
jgi:hypothetical protein